MASSIDTKQILTAVAPFLPQAHQATVAISSPGPGVGFWSGASSATAWDGSIYLAYRTRVPVELGRGESVSIARSRDGVQFETIQTIDMSSVDAAGLGRPALVHTPEDTWRLYLSCATTGTKHWRVEMLEAKSPDGLNAATRQVVMPGDQNWGIKDPVVQIQNGFWHCWATFHPLDEPGHEDRMVSRYAMSRDGVEWTWAEGFCLEPRPGMWDARGTRITAVVPLSTGIIAFYDGRASAAENFEERTGVAVGTSPEHFTAIGDKPFAQSEQERGLRYLDILPLADGSYRSYFEVTTNDDSHELRTQTIHPLF